MQNQNSSPPASATSSQQGQIVSWDSPRSANSYADDLRLSPPPVIYTDEEFQGSPRAKRASSEIGGGDAAAGDGGDRISELPDAVLLSILSSLSLRDAGRTAVLSSRWRDLFDQYLLDFNACQPFPPVEGRGCEWVIRTVTAILAARPHVRIRSFRFVLYGEGFALHRHDVHGWFRTLERRGVRELEVDMFYAVYMSLLPRSVLKFASLETLKVNNCSFPDASSAPALRLPALKTLVLSNTVVSQDSLDAMLSRCPSLECAKLKNNSGTKKICLRSKSLTRLFGSFIFLTELVVEDAPNLEELVCVGLLSSKANVKIVSAPKLQVLGCLGISVRPLVLHDTVFDRGIVRLRSLMHSVKTLAIQVPFSEKGCTVFVTELLKCFPCLETLYVEPDDRSISRPVDVGQWDTETSIQCIEHSINKLVFEYFGGEECQWGFLKFLLGMARALKVVEFYCSEGRDWASAQKELIGAIDRASPDAKFLFFRDCKPVSCLYLCHCCPERCQKELRVPLL